VPRKGVAEHGRKKRSDGVERLVRGSVMVYLSLSRATIHTHCRRRQTVWSMFFDVRLPCSQGCCSSNRARPRKVSWRRSNAVVSGAFDRAEASRQSQANTLPSSARQGGQLQLKGWGCATSTYGSVLSANGGHEWTLWLWVRVASGEERGQRSVRPEKAASAALGWPFW